MEENLATELSNTTGAAGILFMAVSLLCVAIAWWSLQNLKLDTIIRYPKSPQGRLLHLLLAIVLGHFVANFLLDYLGWSLQMRRLF
ncbi:DUF1146 family protein [Paenibacillus glufosinatiresistens]|uniref:DUF1146 family protein n=1 Tax=Paenibacillus glufosinatiresistens TaxID=3070657 RepID=UPI00286DDD56|nr:DUF1146 family protein [Paenibacillus sp. YX.27]